MHRTLLCGLAASLLVVSNVYAAQATSAASTLAWELADASSKCQQMSINLSLQEANDNTSVNEALPSSGAGQHSSRALNAVAEASINRKMNDARYDACVEAARTAGKAAYQKYLASPDPSQLIQNDAKAVYDAWGAALPDLSKAPTPESPEVLALRRAWATLHADETTR